MSSPGTPLLRCSTPDRTRARVIETVAEIGSTNAALLARLGSDAPADENHWLVADRQTAGRGRAGRQWSDGSGNFMGSTTVRLLQGDPPAQTLAFVAGLAVRDAVATLAPDVEGLQLKWPNDLLVAGAKLAGVLLERQGEAVVVGIGVNLAQAPMLPDRPTAALAALGAQVTRDAFARTLAAVWADQLGRWHAGEWPALRAAWLARAHPVGTAIAVHDGAGALLSGLFDGVDAQGAALLRLADGTVRAIHAGDVELVGCQPGAKG